MRDPPRREREPGQPPAPRRGALASHLAHVYRAPAPCAPSITHPLLNRRLYAAVGVFNGERAVERCGWMARRQHGMVGEERVEAIS